MVHSLDCCWNHLLPGLYILQSKLEKYGLTLVNDEISYPDIDTAIICSRTCLRKS
jgi:hypothetical protein